MNTKQTSRKWYSYLLVCKEVVEAIEGTFGGQKIPLIPVYDTYFFHFDYINSLPPGKGTGVEYITVEEKYDTAISALTELANCKNHHSFPEKTILSFAIGKSDIRVVIYKSLNTPRLQNMESSVIFSRALATNHDYIFLPTPEDALLILFAKTFENLGLFFNPDIYAKIDILGTQPVFSWQRFWYYAHDYNLEAFAAYLLLLYKRQKNYSFHIPRWYLLAKILASPWMQQFYIPFPSTMKKIVFHLPFKQNLLHYCLLIIYRRTLYLLILKIRKIYSHAIQYFAHNEIVQAENAAFQNIAQAVISDVKQYQLDKSYDESFLFSTTTGLWLLHDNSIQRLTIGSCYGITRDNERWFLSQRVGNFSRIISFRLVIPQSRDTPSIKDTKVELAGLSLNIHQIDLIDNLLYLVDTIKNRIIIVHKGHKKKIIYPNHLKKQWCPSERNNHFNSLYITNDLAYVVAHNGFIKPKINSQIYVLTRTNYRVKEIINIDSQDAHNIVYFKKDLMYCDSGRGLLIHGDKPFFSDPKHFLRGLAITRKSIVLGGSQIIERSKRAMSDSVLWFLDYSGTPQSCLSLAKIGQVHDLRALSFDLGLSASWKNVQ